MPILQTKTARALYEEFAKECPIIDYHNHINVADLKNDRRYNSLYELWLEPDPYKHRLMRICGVPEAYITGPAEPREKFRKFCEIFPYLAGNPVYDWSLKELREVLNISEMPEKANADRIFDMAAEKLQSSAFSCQGILSRFHVEYQSPVAGLLDDLSDFDGKTVAPSLRGDNLLKPNRELLESLSGATGTTITDLNSYLAAISLLLDKFSAAGCKFADHALDAGFVYQRDDGKNEQRFADAIQGSPAHPQLQSLILKRLGNAYAARGWTLLLHLDAKRQTSPRLARLAGPAGGYAAVGGSFDIGSLCDLLGDMEQMGMPKTVLFSLNLSDQAVLAVMQGSFSQDLVSSKVELGPAWWWCDHIMGMRNTFECVSSFGVLSQFIGMTTDSRSILSFLRHDYYRQTLCAWLDEKCTAAWEVPYPIQGQIIWNLCYQNAKERIL